MKFVTSPERPGSHFASVFLAGSIEQGAAKPWQQDVAKALESFSDGLVVFNPRRAEWDSTLEQDITNPVFNEQVNWEIDGIDQSSVVFFYFQGNTLSPITLLEFGYTLSLRHRYLRIVVVCEPEFWRRGNIQVMVDRSCWHTILLYDNMEEGIKTLKDQVSIVMDCEDW